MLMAAVALPFSSTPSPNGWMPQLAQNRCLMTCLLNVYVLKADSGVATRSLPRGTNHSSEPLRWQIEQLQASALSIMPSTSNATRPQWQLPLYFTRPSFALAQSRQYPSPGLIVRQLFLPANHFIPVASPSVALSISLAPSRRNSMPSSTPEPLKVRARSRSFTVI